jgi:hypothetical protein
LRSGVEARHHAGQALGVRLSLEQIFLNIVGGGRQAVPELSWLE